MLSFFGGQIKSNCPSLMAKTKSNSIMSKSFCCEKKAISLLIKFSLFIRLEKNEISDESKCYKLFTRYIHLSVFAYAKESIESRLFNAQISWHSAGFIFFFVQSSLTRIVLEAWVVYHSVRGKLDLIILNIGSTTYWVISPTFNWIGFHGPVHVSTIPVDSNTLTFLVDSTIHCVRAIRLLIWMMNFNDDFEFLRQLFCSDII